MAVSDLTDGRRVRDEARPVASGILETELLLRPQPEVANRRGFLKEATPTKCQSKKTFCSEFFRPTTGRRFGAFFENRHDRITAGLQLGHSFSAIRAGPRGPDATNHRSIYVLKYLTQKLTKIEPALGHRVRVEFEDGFTAELDLTGLLDEGPIFALLRDAAFFATVRLDRGAPIWGT